MTLAVLLLGSFAGLSSWEMVGDSVTGDERVHLPVGYAYWKNREFRLNPEHPPLVKLLSALPLLAMRLQMPPTEPGPGRNYDEYQQIFGSKFLFTQDADRILLWGRLPVLCLGLLLAFFVFLWSSSLHGHPGAGLLSLFLLAFEPTILAHSHYVTTDVAVACFAVIAMFWLWRFSQTGKLLDLLLASLGLGLALASKFSAVLLAPIFVFLLLVRWPARLAGSRGFASMGRSQKGRIGVTAIALGVAVLVVQASYLFSPDLLLYYRGIRSVNTNRVPGYLYYAGGSFFQGGVWWYPLYACLLKTPIPTLVTVLLAALSCVRLRGSQRSGLLFVCLPVAAFTLATCAFADNLGVRYMIPVSAFLLVLAGRSFFVFSAGRWSRAAGGLLAVWLMVSVLRVSPHFVSYFSELIGGPSNAPHYLDDSNVDWGQDLRRLAEYLADERIAEVTLAYWGPTPPRYYESSYGIRFERATLVVAPGSTPPRGLYAISVNDLIAVRRAIFLLGQDSIVDWLEQFRPVARVGYSIYLYRFP